MLVCGIDENGLGPFLGPLIITAYESDQELVAQSGEVKDSKALFSRRERDYIIIEEFFFEKLHKVGRLVNSLSLADLFCESVFSAQIEKICPIGPRKICFSDLVKVPVWSKIKAFSGVGSTEDFYFAIACPKLLNEKVKAFGSKFSADAYFMSVLALKSRAQKVICGKAGFKKRYAREIIEACRFANVKLNNLVVVKESNEESIYIISLQSSDKDGIKEIVFAKDADKKFHQVAVASVIGKYLRELSMLSLTKEMNLNFQISGYERKDKLKSISEKILERFEKFAERNFDSQKVKSECIERNY